VHSVVADIISSSIGGLIAYTIELAAQSGARPRP